MKSRKHAKRQGRPQTPHTPTWMWAPAAASSASMRASWRRALAEEARTPASSARSAPCERCWWWQVGGWCGVGVRVGGWGCVRPRGGVCAALNPKPATQGHAHAAPPLDHLHHPQLAAAAHLAQPRVGSPPLLVGLQPLHLAHQRLKRLRGLCVCVVCECVVGGASWGAHNGAPRCSVATSTSLPSPQTPAHNRPQPPSPAPVPSPPRAPSP